MPDGHISLVANQFVIRAVKKGGGGGGAGDEDEEFMYSDNLWDVAQRNGLWLPDQGG